MSNTLSRYNRFNSMKALVWSDRFRSIVDKGWCWPIIAHIYPTNKCPFNCPICIMKEEKRAHPVELNPDVLLKFLNEIVNCDIKCVHFSGGGEPTLYKNLIDALSFLEDKSIKIALSTNGWALSPQIASMVNYIRVSLNAATPEVYSVHFSTAPYNFDKVIKNIVEALKYKREDLGLAFLITPENWFEIYDFCALANELEVDFVHIRPSFTWDKRMNDEIIKLMPSARALVEKAKKDFSVEIHCSTEKFKNYWDKPTFSQCKAHWLNVVLTATGDLIPCQDMFIRFGNVAEKSFKDIWLSKEHMQLTNHIDINRCPRCVYTPFNEIIEEVFIKDRMRIALL